MTSRRVALVTLGCARNEVDSEELAGRLAAGGFELVDDAEDADAVIVNTCGFVEAAKTDSIDTLLQAAALNEDGRARTVVAVGCLAERYGEQLAASLPEADAVLGFDHYPNLAARLDDLIAGRAIPSHAPKDRRLLPIVTAQPADPADFVAEPDTPVGGPASGPAPVRRRLGSGPVAALKLASGCDRRCTFCAIPSFRGSFVSRRPHELMAEARWLAEQGVRELHLVSENSTSYGKDLGDIRLLEALLPELAAVEGVTRVRLAYLQPAEMRPSLVQAMAGTPGVAAYFDLSFQHSSPTVLTAMRRFGGTDRFLELIATIRAVAPDAGIRSNVIVGFPGETQADYDELERFLIAARLDAVGVFGYSDEDGTEAAALEPKVPADVIAWRVERLSTLVDVITSERAEERVGELLDVLVESVDGDVAKGRAAHQAPEVDGSVTLPAAGLAVGDMVRCRAVRAEGVDLVAVPVGVAESGPALAGAR